MSADGVELPSIRTFSDEFGDWRGSRRIGILAQGSSSDRPEALAERLEGDSSLWPKNDSSNGRGRKRSEQGNANGGGHCLLSVVAKDEVLLSGSL